MMKRIGIIRRIDELGRITLPMELRKSFNIEEKDGLEIYIDQDYIILKKVIQEVDIFTGETEDLVQYEGKYISRITINNMFKLFGKISTSNL